MVAPRRGPCQAGADASEAVGCPSPRSAGSSSVRNGSHTASCASSNARNVEASGAAQEGPEAEEGEASREQSGSETSTGVEG